LALTCALPTAAEVRYPSGTINWSAPHECPREADVVDQIERLLGQSLGVARKQELLLDARVTGSAEEGYSVTLKVSSSGRTYERTLQHDHCAKLAEGAALVMALAIDPERVAAQGLNEPAPAELQSKPAPAVQPKPASDSEPAPDPSASAEQKPKGERLRVEASGFVLAGAGGLPELGLGFGLGAALRLAAKWRVGVLGQYWLPQTWPVSAQDDAEIGLRLWTIGVRGCWVTPAIGLEVSACAGPDFGQVTAEGRGLEEAHRRSDIHSALLAGVGASTPPRGSIRLALLVEGGPLLRRPRFGVEGWEGEYRADPWALRAGLGAVAAFP